MVTNRSFSLHSKRARTFTASPLNLQICQLSLPRMKRPPIRRLYGYTRVATRHLFPSGSMRRLFRRRGSVLDSTSNWIHYRFISRQRTSKSVLARQSSSSLVSGEWEYWNADFTTRELCMYALNRRNRERSSRSLISGEWECWNADFAARGNLHGRPHLSYVLLEYVQYVPQTFAVWYESIIVP